MGFHEIRFPTEVTKGTQGGPALPADVLTPDSGQDVVTVRYSAARRRYNAAKRLKHTDIATVHRFYLARGGLANGFRYQDLQDYTSTLAGRTWGNADDTGAAPTPTDQVLGTGDGTTVAFQLVKRYTDAASSHVRTIRKPVAGTVRVAVAGVEKTIGSDFTVDTTTGLVTFAVAPSAAASVTAGFEFDVPVRFGVEVGDGGLIADIDNFGVSSLGDIPLIEMLDDADTPEDFPYGGSAPYATPGASVGVPVSLGARVNVIAPTNTGAFALLPVIDDLPHGGPLLAILNASGAQNLAVKEQRGDPVVVTTLFTLTPGQAAQLWIGPDAAAAPKWYRF